MHLASNVSFERGKVKIQPVCHWQSQSATRTKWPSRSSLPQNLSNLLYSGGIIRTVYAGKGILPVPVHCCGSAGVEDVSCFTCRNWFCFVDFLVFNRPCQDLRYYSSCRLQLLFQRSLSLIVINFDLIFISFYPPAGMFHHNNLIFKNTGTGPPPPGRVATSLATFLLARGTCVILWVKHSVFPN